MKKIFALWLTLTVLACLSCVPFSAAAEFRLLDDQTPDGAGAAPTPAPTQLLETASANAASGAEGASTPDADEARMVLVLDASGSMWGQIEGKAKIEIA